MIFLYQNGIFATMTERQIFRKFCFLDDFPCINNQFSRFSLQYEPSTINKSSSRHLCLETFSNILTFYIPPALSRQWVCYQTIAGATASKWFWEKQQTSWLSFFRQYVVLQLDYFVQIRWNIFNLYEDKVQKM